MSINWTGVSSNMRDKLKRWDYPISFSARTLSSMSASVKGFLKMWSPLVINVVSHRMIIPIVLMTPVISSLSNVLNARKNIMVAVQKSAVISAPFLKKSEGYFAGSGCLMGVSIPRQNLDY